MITKPQAILIKEICRIQKESLETVFMEPDLGEEREEILKMFGAKRSDFDQSLVKAMGCFKKLDEDPEYLYELEYYDLIVVLFILSYLTGKEGFKDKYPKALMNLGNKVNYLITIKELIN